VRRRKRPGKNRWSTETAYAITSLTAPQASPAKLAATIRGHWMIEDRLHWVRSPGVLSLWCDMDYDEDRSQIRTASGPRIMASLRNLALTTLRLTGATSIAAALRYHARRPDRPLRTIMNCHMTLLRPRRDLHLQRVASRGSSHRTGQASSSLICR
jgi:predicted transposase YbfD/YdcC